MLFVDLYNKLFLLDAMKKSSIQFCCSGLSKKLIFDEENASLEWLDEQKNNFILCINLKNLNLNSYFFPL